MKVLIACETSGTVRDAFIAKGHDAMSCDLLPTEKPGPHYQGDVQDILNNGWDLMIAHPDCTYLTNSAAWAFGDGPYHQKIKPGTLVGEARREARREAIAFVKLLMDAPIPLIAIENPVGSISTYIRPADQYIQPYEYGHDASKKTGLWLKGLPLLTPIKYVEPRLVCCGVVLTDKYGCPNCCGDKKPLQRWGNQTNSGQNKLTPGPMRWLDRARTYQGWADAMADQWGGL
ncbi:hypothetical protein [Arsukibacterium sp.]|uniref:hypothetical protein n=1 Tax=Arsukibacterium sp. TaxID=1977258 RepID=UPI002FD9844D